MLEINHVTKTYNPGLITEVTIFRDFSLNVEKGEFVSVVGSNGSGKTTLLNIICGSIGVEAGEIRISGRDVTHEKEYCRYRSIGRVYQNPALGTAPELTIFENMSLADHKGGRYGLSRGVNRARREDYREMLAGLDLGLENKMDVRMGSLSGGQRQAVSLLMATMTPLDFLILDEHTAALDPKTAEIIMQLTDRVIREKKLTAIMVTHNLRHAVEYGSRLLMLDRGGIVLDKAGEEKKALSVEDVLGLFNSISIECGN